MTAIKIGERYRCTWQGIQFGQVGVVTHRDSGNRFRFECERDGDVLYVHPDYLEPVAPPVPPFSNGDVVKLTSPDGEVTHQGPISGDVWLGRTPGERMSVTIWLDAGYSLEVVEHAPKPLPTVDGHYLSKGGVVYELHEGEWFWAGDFGKPESHQFMVNVSPLTRLVAEVSAS
ncbi:hypothetical protein [Plantibacter sp. YIM 135249]|uniref:hypothetical protein n=1 Tax=Plantibacter sp. YIM 135249 TaxID=3423918 RepID=UPI003D35239B